MKKTRTININSIFIIVVVFIFACISIKLCYVALSKNVDGKDLKAFADARYTKKETINAKRGTIYASDKEVLAKDVNSYTVVAVLSSSKTTNPDFPHHVVDKELTAEKLSPLINMTKESILKLLNMENVYQVELGPGGRGITELVKDEIEDLDLPGIEFTSSSKRYYPNGEFLSYTLGYAKYNKAGSLVGEMGLEEYYNEELSGTNGYTEYQADREGYQMTTSPTLQKEAISGNDIYLTIDTNIQMFVEQAMTNLEKSSPEWGIVAAVNAKTGEILGISSTPRFNNNTLEIKSYYDPFVAYEYEPGSTMKIFSFMASIENGLYNGTETYKSGSLKVDDATIKDWNKSGWGNITYDEGFMGSSNVAASKLALNLGRAKLKDFYVALGFGSTTGIGLPNESKGTINFKYNTEIASASFGQGVGVTGIQMIQALTTLANEGTMIKPYIVSKIVDSNTGSTVLENERTEVKKVASKETVDKMISLMRGVVDGSAKMSTGKDYYINNYDVIGKTGTAEIASAEGGYLTGTRNYVRSFAGLFPGENPQIIIYVAASKMTSSKYLKTTVKPLIESIGTYLNIYGQVKEEDTRTFKIDNYINKDALATSEIINSSSLEAVVLGNGNTIIKQYPESKTELNLGNKVFLLTNGLDVDMPNIEAWSRSDVTTFCNLLNLKVSFEGYGYVKTFSIPKGTKIDLSSTLNVTLESKFVDTVKKEE